MIETRCGVERHEIYHANEVCWYNPTSPHASELRSRAKPQLEYLLGVVPAFDTSQSMERFWVDAYIVKKNILSWLSELAA